jgi:Bax protein
LKKAISAVILLFFAGIMTLALFDAPTRVETLESAAEGSGGRVDGAAADRLSVAERKQFFIAKTLPAIRSVKSKLDALYDYVLLLSQKETLTPQEALMLDALKKRYKVAGIPCLLNRLRTHPVSIVLAQAALETGWGRSRFYNEANNIFGIWSFNANEPRIAAGENRGKKTIYVKKYPTLEASIESYFTMMATARAYGDFRQARRTEKNPFKLLRHLTRYSELRGEYVKRLYYVIKANRFYEYDQPSYQPISLAVILPEEVPDQQIAQAETLQNSKQNAALAAVGVPSLQMRLPLEERDDIVEEENSSECPPDISAPLSLEDGNRSEG